MKEIELSKLDMTLYYDKLKNGLEVYLLPYDNKNNYYISYGGRIKTFKVIDYLYNDCNIYLNRKYNKYIELKSTF